MRISRGKFLVGPAAGLFAAVALATAAWAFYSWLLTRPGDPPGIRNDWAAFLMAQIVPGLVWSGLFTAGEWAMTDAHMVWSWPVAAVLLYVAVGPAIVAYRCWGLGVAEGGPALAAFFNNLTPLFAALLSTLVLGDSPQPYHAAAFALIVGGLLLGASLLLGGHGDHGARGQRHSRRRIADSLRRGAIGPFLVDRLDLVVGQRPRHSPRRARRMPRARGSGPRRSTSWSAAQSQ